MYYNNLFESLVVAEIMLHTMNTNHSLDRLPGGCGNSERMVTEMAVDITRCISFSVHNSTLQSQRMMMTSLTN